MKALWIMKPYQAAFIVHLNDKLANEVGTEYTIHPPPDDAGLVR
jgi:hypothetical protein